MKIIMVVVIALWAFNCFAFSKTGEVGLRMNKENIDGTTSKDPLRVQAGLIVGMPINKSIEFRTGGVLAMKDGETESPPIKVTTSKLFLDVPVTLQFGNDSVQGYAGVLVGLKLASSCSFNTGGTCTIRDEKSLVVQPTLGGNFSVSPGTKIGIFYEVETEYSRALKQSGYGVTLGFDI
jgi:hypothetical protein